MGTGFLVECGLDPDGVPMKWSEGNEIIHLSDSKSRVNYKTNTMRGSSGSPCFNKDFELIAMHNYGETNSDPPFNRGIPIVTIVEDLKRNNCFHYLDQLAQIHKRLPKAYPFFNELNKQIHKARKLRKHKTELAHMYYQLLLNYDDVERSSSYWLFMAISLHITIIGDPRMKERKNDQLLTQLLTMHERMLFDEPQLIEQAKKLETTKVYLDHPEDKINLNDYYEHEQVIHFLRQLSEAVSIRWRFIKYLHDNWQYIYIGSEIIEHSKICLAEMSNDIGRTLNLFHMYKKLNKDGWSPHKKEKFEEFESLSNNVTNILAKISKRFADLNHELSSRSKTKVESELASEYVKLPFFIADYQDVIHELIDICEDSI